MTCLVQGMHNLSKDIDAQIWAVCNLLGGRPGCPWGERERGPPLPKFPGENIVVFLSFSLPFSLWNSLVAPFHFPPPRPGSRLLCFPVCAYKRDGPIFIGSGCRCSRFAYHTGGCQWHPSLAPEYERNQQCTAIRRGESADHAGRGV